MNSIKHNKPIVLIVDDIPKNLQVLGNILSVKDYEISFAQNGKQALNLVDVNKPDLILLDIMMPELDGYEVCKTLKSDITTSDIPIIFLTGKAESEDIVKGFKSGAVDYVTKPFNPIELLSRVETHLALKRSKDDLKIYSKELEEYQKELKEVIAAKDRFFSIIAHDLRSPFSGLLGLSSILEDEYDKIEKNELSEIGKSLNQAAKRLFNLLENLLEWSRSQMGHIEYSPRKVDLFDTVFKNIYLLETNAKNKSIEVINGINRNTFLYADENMLNTILRNLISNSIKFTPDYGHISIKCNKLSDELCEIIIKDDGIGMDQKILDKLFKIDEKFSNKGTNNERGTGLGLILVKELIGKHGGNISVKSKIGEGSEFTFSLPIFKD